MTSNQLRQLYLDFFEKKGHKILPSASLIPENDPTVLFTTAGMHPLVPFLLGEKHPAGKRLANVQKCVRTQDIDEVGDNRHETFFEMLGNWSLGDYFKKESISWSWEFLTSKEWLGLDSRKIAVSVFAGDSDAPRDEESAGIWKSLGVPEHKIAYLPKKNNWWGPAGQTGPCGPDTEIFYWQGKEEYPGEKSDPGSDEDNWLEIWNNVFMEYNKNTQGKYEPLSQKNVDTGMGLERTLVALNGLQDVFQTDVFLPLINKIEELSGRKYDEAEGTKKAIRIIADHIRTAIMIMGDDKAIVPSNVQQGYVLRRLIRRAIRYGKTIGVKEGFASGLIGQVLDIYKNIYPEINRNKNFIAEQLSQEEEKFGQTLEKGLKEFNKGTDPFILFTTYGFPIEMTEELAIEQGRIIDKDDFWKKYKEHQELSRTASAGMFKGGLADAGEQAVKYHTINHLLLAALRKVLGEHVFQKGSNITAERLRFDFSHLQKMTDKEIKQVEDLVNQKIKENLPVVCEEMGLEEAKSSGAMGVFESKYGERVKVYTIGGPGQVFSKEICGGPHVENTGKLGAFKIIKEESSSSGIRRIKGVLE